MSDKIILPDSSEAAQPCTIEGWRSRDGYLYTDEHAARSAGSTHTKCRECGFVIPKITTICASCRTAAEIERYAAMPRAKWDGEAMLYSQTRDEYFADLDHAADTLEEDEDLAVLRLVICNPNYASPLDTSYFHDDLPDEEDQVPSALDDAIDAFNEAVAGIVLSWWPGKCAMELPTGEPQT